MHSWGWLAPRVPTNPEVHDSSRMVLLQDPSIFQEFNFTLFFPPSRLPCPQKYKFGFIFNFVANLSLMSDLMHFAFSKTCLVLQSN